LSALRKSLEETENRLQEALSNESLARRDCLKQLEEAKAVSMKVFLKFLLLSDYVCFLFFFQPQCTITD